MNRIEYSLHTGDEGFYNITGQVREALKRSGIKSGLCVVYTPHTTAAITINENADPDVRSDLLRGLAASFPDLPVYRHVEGNSAAHMKSSCFGCSKTLIVEDGALLLGRWQDIYFCEFDGPRIRRFFVKFLED